ncbi:hypothetical protein HBI23_257380 [Parastagonospora nodorum]|nr:hypothetical protein HBI23_257380 [Parastagonospora nodorum]KAH5619813.1 hypothetical protein HBI51_252010 [Parastagonospora nodorum]KAH6132284.1 hypothetical protein HBI68_255740 [Parastagonospora nodorum]KAH6382946.1 hypothetical protein HBI60_259350 [Parastagonospora nodorum]
MVVEVVEELGRHLFKVIKRQLLEKKSTRFDVVSINGKSMRVRYRGTSQDRI